jgi:AcrR family transcriptional regulator
MAYTPKQRIANTIASDIGISELNNASILEMYTRAERGASSADCGEVMFAMDKRTGARRPSRRDAQKAETRARVVAAARALFSERGYEAATIRDIAKRARVAPGSVFTTFASKAELLHEIVYAKYAVIFPALADAASKPGGAHERLVEMARIGYDFEMQEVRLVADTMGASWTWPAENEMQNRRQLAPLWGYMADILNESAKAGELQADVDINLVSEILIGCYVRNFRRALYDGWNAKQLAQHYARQCALVLGGASATDKQAAEPI